ncbi:MAG: carboxymuconolactone decarboxylase family protein [Candidatus Methanomethylophilaceae archaeon]
MSLHMLNERDSTVLKSLYKYRKEVFKEGSLTVREKELIALALSSASKCEACLEYHAEKAKEAGATGQDILEVMELVTYMTGPSGIIWTEKIDEIVK